MGSRGEVDKPTHDSEQHENLDRALRRFFQK